MNSETALSQSEITTLIEALTAWEDKDAAGELVGQIFEHTFAAGMPPPAAIQEARRKRAADKVNRQERSIMLKAKLLRLRDAIAAEQVLSEGAQRP